MTTPKALEAAAHEMHRQAADLRWEQTRAHIPIFVVGDRARVLRTSCVIERNKYDGWIGTVEAVLTKRALMVVLPTFVERAYLLRFDNGDSWALADADLQPADAPYQPRKQRKARKG